MVKFRFFSLNFYHIFVSIDKVLEHQWSKAYKPKRKLYVLRSRESEGFDDFCQENGYDWYKCFSNIYRPLANRALFYMPEKMMTPIFAFVWRSGDRIQ